ncbi:MAG: hypothetical protein E7812_03750 [Phenylobacterium sp.]|nr:MAG: hypothetical protein E7812_03750 [Phenylobacterium sp.]
MIALKVQKFGDQLAVILSDEALELMNAEGGVALHLEPTADGEVLCAITQELRADDHHARGRAFLKRYTRALERH